MALIITDLPLEVIVHILSFLPIMDLLQALLVCRVLYHAANIAYSRQHHNQLGLCIHSLRIVTYCILEGGQDIVVVKDVGYYIAM